MNNKTTEHNPGASETTRFFCTRISSAASAVDKFKKHRKEPNMANKNTNPVGGKTAVPADINNAQPAYFPKPHHTWEGQRPRCPQPQPETAQNAKIKLSAKTAQYRNQISTLLGVPPLISIGNIPQRPRRSAIPKSSYLKKPATKQQIFPFLSGLNPKILH